MPDLIIQIMQQCTNYKDKWNIGGYEQWDWPHERTKKITEKLQPDVIMHDGMSGRPFALCFPFTFGNTTIYTPEQWAWLKEQLKDYDFYKKEQ